MIDLPPLDAQPGPARPIREGEAQRMIDAALDAHFVSRPVYGFPRWALAASVLMAVSVGATAAVWVYAPRSRPAAVPSPSPSPSPSPAAVIAPEPERVAPPVERPAKRVERARLPRARPRAAPADLLKIASTHRAAKRWGKAAMAYRRVRLRSSAGPSGYVATIAEAEIRLEHLGEVRGAIRLFRAAIAAGGALDGEARYGLARAYREADEPAKERAALEDFLTRHPSSPLAALARKRLDAL